MSDAIAASKKAHDASRQARAVLVRLSEEEAEAADKMLQKGETRAKLQRRLLNEKTKRRAK